VLSRFGITDNANAVVALAATVSAAYTSMCPAQFDVAVEQISGIAPIHWRRRRGRWRTRTKRSPTSLDHP